MSEIAYNANFNNMDGLRTVVYDAEAVPDEIWFALQRIQYESIKANLPQEEWERAATIVSHDDFRTYQETRVDPNILVGNGWNDDQLFRRPMVAVTYDGSNQPISGVLTADNSSASLPLPQQLRPLEYWAKMLTPPGLDLPGRIGKKVSGKRYVHLRESYVMPDVQEELDAGESDNVVSGIVLTGLWYSLHRRHPAQNLVAYTKPADPADKDFVHLTQTLGMEQTGYRASPLPGYRHEAKLVIVRAGVRQVLSKILVMPGANDALSKVTSSRPTKAEQHRLDRQEEKRRNKEYWKEYQAQKESQMYRK